MALTQGHAIICCDRNRRGGLKRIWLMEQGNLTGTVAYASSGDGPGADAHGGEISSFIGSAWYEFEFEKFLNELENIKSFSPLTFENVYEISSFSF